MSELCCTRIHSVPAECGTQFCEERPEALPTISGASDELSAICRGGCGQKLQITGQKRAGATKEAKKQDDTGSSSVSWCLKMPLQLLGVQKR